MTLHQYNENWIIEDDLNLDLVKDINSLIDENLDDLPNFREGLSPAGENIDQYWLTNVETSFNFKNEKFKSLEKKYKNQILNRLKKLNLLNQEYLKISDLTQGNCWSVIGGQSSYHRVHCHSSSTPATISTVLYLKIPDTNNESILENNIFLIMNSSLENKFYSNSQRIIHINPYVGKLLIFPSWIIHGTYPQTKGIRQTFNMEYHYSNKFENISYNYE